jgi:hypothetical protein
VSIELWGFEEQLPGFFAFQRWGREPGVLIWQADWRWCGSLDDLCELLFGRFPALGKRTALPMRRRQ